MHPIRHRVVIITALTISLILPTLVHSEMSRRQETEHYVESLKEYIKDANLWEDKEHGLQTGDTFSVHWVSPFMYHILVNINPFEGLANLAFAVSARKLPAKGGKSATHDRENKPKIPMISDHRNWDKERKYSAEGLASFLVSAQQFFLARHHIHYASINRREPEKGANEIQGAGNSLLKPFLNLMKSVPHEQKAMARVFAVYHMEQFRTKLMNESKNTKIDKTLIDEAHTELDIAIARLLTEKFPILFPARHIKTVRELTYQVVYKKGKEITSPYHITYQDFETAMKTKERRTSSFRDRLRFLFRSEESKVNHIHSYIPNTPLRRLKRGDIHRMKYYKPGQQSAVRQLRAALLKN